jgi:two-component system, response regulator PdtaR
MKTASSSSNNLKHTILLVDDDRLVLSTLAQGLKSAGYDVFTAESADEAEILLMAGGHPDLAILDVNMPGRNGLDLAERLSTFDQIPFMLLTAYNDEAIVEQAARSGALGYLVKPIDVPELIPSIEASLARAREIKGLRINGDQLQLALSSERDISIAVGITMVQYRTNRRGAFEMLRKKARDERRRLAELAAEVIKASEMLNFNPKLNK